MTHLADNLTAAAPVKVLPVDDHRILRPGLRALLADRPGLEVVGEAADGRAALTRGPQRHRVR